MVNRWGLQKKEQKAVERFFNNKRVELSSLIHQIQEQCRANCPARHVLLIQDTSELNYNSHNGRLRLQDQDLGVLSDNRSTGLFVHPGLAIDATNGLPVGYGSLKIFNHHFSRPSRKKEEHQSLPIEQKRSYRWLETLQESRGVLSRASQITMIADRESDIYELFGQARSSKEHLLVRSSWNRRIEQGGQLQAYLDQQASQHSFDIQLSGQAKRQARKAHLQLKWCKVSLLKPKKKKKLLSTYPDSIELTVVQAKEVPSSVPAGEEPIHWCLLTTHEVEQFEDAVQLINWYRQRWWIEELFRLMKTKGFQIESSQFSSGAALKKLVALTLEQALQVLTLRQARQSSTDVQANLCFKQEQQQFLHHLEQQVQGPTPKQQNPFESYSLAWATWIIARLGGWKPAHMNKRPPGIITLKRGLDKFNQQFQGWKLAAQFFQNGKAPPT